MIFRNIRSALVLSVLAVAASCSQAEVPSASVTVPRTVVYYSHSTFRCGSCLALEGLVREAILGDTTPLAADVLSGSLSLRVVNLDTSENAALAKKLGVGPKTVLVTEEVSGRIVRKAELDKVWFLLDDKNACQKYIRSSVQAFADRKELDGMIGDVPGTIISASDAYARSSLVGKADSMHIVDVRTPGEHSFVGHPKGSRNIPFLLMTYAYNAKLKKQGMRKNMAFVEQVKRHYSPDDHLAFLCRSGPRAAMAVRALAKNGFKHLYVIRHGFEGEREGRETSSDYGKRVLNGWRNEGLAWTTSLDPTLMYIQPDTVASQSNASSKDISLPERQVAPTWLMDAPFAPVFQVKDTEHKYGRYDPAVKTITLTDLIRFHGHFCGGLVEAAGALKQALDVLFPDGVVDRTDLEIATRNSACGVDVATYLTGTRVRYGSCRLGKQFKASEFVVRRLSSGATVRVRVRDTVVPTDVRKQMRKIQVGADAPADIDLFRDLQWGYARRLVTRPLAESYTVDVLDRYEMPEPVTTAWGVRGDNAYKTTPRVVPAKTKVSPSQLRK